MQTAVLIAKQRVLDDAVMHLVISRNYYLPVLNYIDLVDFIRLSVNVLVELVNLFLKMRVDFDQLV